MGREGKEEREERAREGDEGGREREGGTGREPRRKRHRGRAGGAWEGGRAKRKGVLAVVNSFVRREGGERAGQGREGSDEQVGDSSAQGGRGGRQREGGRE